jgi:hypothetical protein
MAIFTKLFLMIFGKFTWEKLVSILLKFGQNKLTDYLTELSLSRRVVMFIRLLHLLAGELGKEWANDTKMTNIDNETVAFVVDTAEALSAKHDFELPELLL